jgi:hypothetical protein
MSATVSIVSEPDYLEPMRESEIWYRLTSASASVLTDYKYVIDLWTLNSSNILLNKLGRFKVPPRPTDNQAYFSVNKPLYTQISVVASNTIFPGFTTSSGNPAKCINPLYTRYTIQYGFEYNPNLYYYDFTNVPSFGLAFQSNPQLLIGDVITVNKINNTANSQYNGVYTIGTVSSGTVSIPGLTFGAYFVGVNGTFGISTPVGFDEGYITNLLRVGSTASNRLSYYGTRQYEQNNINFTTNYLLKTGSTDSNFLTNYVGWKPIKNNEWETRNIMVESSVSPTYSIELKTYDSSNVQIGTYSVNGNFTTNCKYFAIGTGTRNLKSIHNDNNLFNNVYKYTIQLKSSSDGDSEVLNYGINYECSLYPDVRLVFLNKMGGYDYWTFDRDNKKTVNINRTEYKKVLMPDYVIGDRGQTPLATDAQYVYTLNSNWVSEYDCQFLEELIHSPNVYIVNSDESLTPIVITDSNYVIKTQLRDRLFNLTINYKLSYNLNI